MATGLQDFSITFSSRIFVLLTNLGIQSCLAWFLGPGGRGSYAICLIFATLLSIIFVIGCDVTSIYFVASKRFNISEGIIYTFIYGAIGSGLAIIAGLIIMQLQLSFLDKATPATLHLALMSIPISLFAMILVHLLTSIRQFVWFAVMSVLHGLYHLLLAIVFVWIFSGGVIGALLAMILAGTITIVSTLFLFRLKFGITFVKPSIRDLREMFSYGVRYYVGKLSNLMNFQIGTLLLALFATKEEVGLFAVASRVVIQALIIPDTVSAVLIPRVGEDEIGKRKLVAQCSRLSGLACGTLLLILAISAKFIVPILFSKEFLPAVPLIQILAVGIAIRCACKVFLPYLLITGHPGTASISIACGTIVNLVTLWILLPVMGLPGAAVAMVAGHGLSSILLAISFSRFSCLSFKEIWRYQQSDWATVKEMVKYCFTAHIKRI